MKKYKMISLNRFLLYTGIITQIAYIISTPFNDISVIILFSTGFLLFAGYLDLSIAKASLQEQKSTQELIWAKKRDTLKDYYNNDFNVDKSFSASLAKVQFADSHDKQITKILENYQTNKKKFKIKLIRNQENRIGQYFQE